MSNAKQEWFDYVIQKGLCMHLNNTIAYIEAYKNNQFTTLNLKEIKKKIKELKKEVKKE
ncbi:MAG: hypothetical protein R6V12_15155 [Candidatus Hydrogenedentota bacterium]